MFCKKCIYRCLCYRLFFLFFLFFSFFLNFFIQKRLIDKRVGVTAETVEKGTVIIGYRSCTCLDCISLLSNVTRQVVFTEEVDDFTYQWKQQTIKFYVIRKIGEKNSVLLRELKTVNDIEHFTLHVFE